MWSGAVDLVKPAGSRRVAGGRWPDVCVLCVLQLFGLRVAAGGGRGRMCAPENCDWLREGGCARGGVGC